MTWFVDFYHRISKAMSNSNKINQSNDHSNKITTKNQYAFKLYQFQEIFPLNSEELEIPYARSGHRIACNTTDLYVYGGYTPQYVDPVSGLQRDCLFNELWQFNFATRKWMLLPGEETIPPALASPAVLFDGNTLMVYGGTSLPFGMHCSNKLYFCTLTKSQFYHGMKLIRVTGSIPPGMYGQTLLYHNDYLYVVGGTTGYDYSCDIHRLNLSTNKWEDVYIDSGGLEYAPAGRYRHEIAFDGECIYVIGGGTSSSAYDLENIPTFDINSRVWHKKITKRDPKAGIPGPRMCHSCVQFREDSGEIFAYIVGGNNGPEVYNEMWRLQLSNLQWTKISNAPLPFPIYFNSACVTPEGKMYMFGGINRHEFRRTNSLHSAWVIIPKLSELCWEALLFYCPNLHKAPKQVLLNVGVPMHFVNRLQNNLKF